MTVTTFPLQKRAGYNADSLPNPLYNHTARTLATHELKWINSLFVTR